MRSHSVEMLKGRLRAALVDHPQEKIDWLLAISVSTLEEHPVLQLELPIGLEDEACRPGSKRGTARWGADSARLMPIASDGRRSATDRSRWGIPRSVPDDFRQLAEKKL